MSVRVVSVSGGKDSTAADAKEWAKTSRGGRQFDMFQEDEADVPTCMSTWGVCGT